MKRIILIILVTFQYSFQYVVCQVKTWTYPISIDTSRNIVLPQISVSSHGQIAILELADLYISNDQGNSFQWKYRFLPDFQGPLHLYVPGGIVYDSKGQLWINWIFDKCSDNECTFSTENWSYLSKSIDSGMTFTHVLKQKRGLGTANNGTIRKYLWIDKYDNIHWLYDSLNRAGEKYQLGRQYIYCKIQEGDISKRNDYRLPPVPDSLSYGSTDMRVSKAGSVHITRGFFPRQNQHYYQTYSKFENDSFETVVLYDSSAMPDLFPPIDIYDRENGELYLFQDQNPMVGQGRYYRKSIDGGKSFSAVAKGVLESNSIVLSDSSYLYSYGYYNNSMDCKFYTLSSLSSAVVDSSIVVHGVHNEFQFYSFNKDAKYVVFSDLNHRGYFAKTSTISKINSEKLKLEQPATIINIFPNPTNSSSTINVEILHKGFVEIDIFDVLGKKIMMLFNGHLNPGTYSYLFKTSDYSSGTYFIKVSIDGSNTFKKLINQK